jgi:hypothetical protein
MGDAELGAAVLRVAVLGLAVFETSVLHPHAIWSTEPLTVRTTIRLVAAHIGLGPRADGGQHRRTPSKLAAQM